jgi:hypothetical protein
MAKKLIGDKNISTKVLKGERISEDADSNDVCCLKN